MRQRYYLRSEGLIISRHDPYQWDIDQVFAVGEMSLNTQSYVCIAAHITDAAHEPGVGADWEDVFELFSSGQQGIPGGTLTWRGLYAAGTEYSANDGVISAEGRGCYALQNTTGHAPPSYPTLTNTWWSVFAEKGSDSSGGVGFWNDMPGTPTRVSDSQFTIDDASNTNLYNKIFSKGTIIKWEKSGGGFQCAMIKAAAYSSNAVTIDILGNDLVAGFTAMKYCIHRAEQDVFIIPGNMPGNTVTTDLAKTIYATQDLLVFAAQVRYKTAPTTTKGVWDINDDGTSIFTAKPEIAAAATLGVEQISNCILDTALTVVAKDSAITLDYDSGHATTPGANAYVTIWYMPEAWRYQS